MLDTVVLFFALGFAARLAKSELKLPAPLYEALSIYLLLAIGLKGGAELAKQNVLTVLPQVGAVLLLGVFTALLAFALLRAGRIAHADAAAIAGHYGSVSVVTFAVASNTLVSQGIDFEAVMPLFLVLMEVPGIVAGILLARLLGPRDASTPVAWGPLLHEVFLGKGLVLLVGGLLIGWVAGSDGLAPMKPFFGDLFKGTLCLFLLEMGLVAAGQIGGLKRGGLFLAGFAIVMPLLGAMMGTAFALMMGLSVGGTMLLATLAASASYIAAPAAMRIAIPEASPGLSITCALAITFPFNLLAGIPIYLWMARLAHSMAG
ncbi:sodium-dependent bicarbonate transport family permease [Methyloversatilis universalis]|uniref:sodium-dependent bicarbonate transport family permease n=1 Tax=Methyloversatilis universalis TaxID=378211 RepID=UPI000366B9D8|nr:sodium-dependent bicarbonate transport family permease [Methyloversatilis universalis]